MSLSTVYNESLILAPSYCYCGSTYKYVITIDAMLFKLGVPFILTFLNGLHGGYDIISNIIELLGFALSILLLSFSA